MQERSSMSLPFFAALRRIFSPTRWVVRNHRRAVLARRMPSPRLETLEDRLAPAVALVPSVPATPPSWVEEGPILTDGNAGAVSAVALVPGSASKAFIGTVNGGV